MVTWPITCCEAIRSAILATAWLLVLIEAWTQPLSRCWWHCQVRTDGRSDAHSCSEEKRSCRQRSSMKTSQKQDDTSQLYNSPGLYHHHRCCCCCCCCHDNDVNRRTCGGLSFTFFLSLSLSFRLWIPQVRGQPHGFSFSIQLDSRHPPRWAAGPPCCAWRRRSISFSVFLCSVDHLRLPPRSAWHNHPLLAVVRAHTTNEWWWTDKRCVVILDIVISAVFTAALNPQLWGLQSW